MIKLSDKPTLLGTYRFFTEINNLAARVGNTARAEAAQAEGSEGDPRVIWILKVRTALNLARYRETQQSWAICQSVCFGGWLAPNIEIDYAWNGEH